jgi:arylsulfatase A-like enzyme
MKPTALGIAAAALSALAACSPAPKPPAGATLDPRPDVVFILTDDQRWDAMSCAGHPHLKTPHLDRIAAEGARFANAFCTTSLCSPSRASYLSGLYAHAHGVVNNFTDFPKDLPSFPRRLQEAGYETAYIGKWHMGEEDDARRPGFDFWMSHKGQGKYVDTEFNINGERRVVPGYYTRVVTDAAVDWLCRRGDRPFCLILGHKAPHSPNDPEAKYAGAFDAAEIRLPPSASDLAGKPDWVRQRIPTWHGIKGPLWGSPDFPTFVRRYWSTLLSVDDSVGRIVEALNAAGRLGRTLLVFAGDNGFFLGEHGMMDKRTMHEPSIRVPLLVRYPPLVKGPRTIREMALNVDLAPSVLDICGARPIERVHGMSFKRLLGGDAAGWRTSWHYAYDYEKQFPYTPNVRGVRTDAWKYIHYPHGDGGPDRHRAELYDLREDPLELHNRVDDPAAAGMLKALRSDLERRMKETGALPDRMPIDEGIKTDLPEKSIR